MNEYQEQRKYHVRVQVREFKIPPIHEGLVLGRDAAIGCTAILRALKLLTPSPFEHIKIEDDVVGDILIRSALLRRLPRQKLIDFVLARIKPLMGPEELLHLDLSVELDMEDQFA